MSAVTEPNDAQAAQAPIALPRIRITYCTQCRWMLRAAYFAQELLSTFGLAIGEISLVPATGGIFTVTLTYKPPTPISNGEDANKEASDSVEPQTVLLWDRKAEGGFPETKVLKQLLRDRIEPFKDLGHSDKGKKAATKTEATKTPVAAADEVATTTKTTTELPERTQECSTCP